MNDKEFNTPILLLIFNRERSTMSVLEEVKKLKPSSIYIACDGARNKEEEEIVVRLRETVLSFIDWKCEIKTLFRNENLGCRESVSRSINWFFSEVEEGIILEDDCLPNQSFFKFCSKMLERYREDKSIWHISGCNFQEGIKRGDGSYYFSHYAHIWGWATWRDRWDSYDVYICEKSDDKFIENIFLHKKVQKYWKKIFLLMKNREINTWDYQWLFTVWKNRGKSITPNVNLISNIGFGHDATHTKEISSQANLPRIDMESIIFPSVDSIDIEADEFSSVRIFALPLYNRIKNKLKKFVKFIV